MSFRKVVSGTVSQKGIPTSSTVSGLVNAAVADLVSSAPAALDTINELALALNNDANFATTVTNSLANKANINNPTFTGTISGNASASSTAANSANALGFKGIPTSSAGASGSYTLTASDAGELVYTTSSRTVTIPANSSVPFEIGTSIVFISGSGATTTIAINSDTLLLAGQGTTGSRTLAAHGMATAVKVAATTWYISGNGLS